MRKVLRKAVGVLPRGLVRYVGQLQFRVPMLASVIRKVAATLAEGEGVIQSGVGKGLRFDATGGYAGYILGTSEAEEQEILARFLKPGDVFYDLGANVGFYTILGAKLVGERGMVYAFEPTPGLAESVRRNIALNGFGNVHLVEAAVADREGTTRFLSTDYGAGNRIAGDETGSATDAIEVRLTSIDAFVDQTGAPLPGVVMMDIEGAEVDALRGMRRTLEKARPVILCEVHWLGEGMTACFDEVLRPLGYAVTTYSGEPVPEGYVRYHALMAPSAGARRNASGQDRLN